MSVITRPSEGGTLGYTLYVSDPGGRYRVDVPARPFETHG